MGCPGCQGCGPYTPYPLAREGVFCYLLSLTSQLHILQVFSLTLKGLRHFLTNRPTGVIVTKLINNLYIYNNNISIL